MRHAVAIPKRSLPIPVALSADVSALVPAAGLATPGPIPCIPTLRAAVPLPTVVLDTDLEQLAAVEALDLDEVDRVARQLRRPLSPGGATSSGRRPEPQRASIPLAARGLEA